jgi:hypothetical protein
MTGFLISLGMTSYTLSILFFALKPIVKNLLSIKIVIFHIYTLGSIIGKKYWSQEVALNKLEKGLLTDYETAFCSVLALTVLGKIFKY